jgi:hypothetical protein
VNDLDAGAESNVEEDPCIPTVVPLLDHQVVICDSLNGWPDRLDSSHWDASRSYRQSEGVRGLIHFEGAEKQILDLGLGQKSRECIDRQILDGRRLHPDFNPLLHPLAFRLRHQAKHGPCQLTDEGCQRVGFRLDTGICGVREDSVGHGRRLCPPPPSLATTRIAPDLAASRPRRSWRSQPFTTPTGRSRATLAARPALWHTSATWSTSLYAYGASSASNRAEPGRIEIPASSN